MSAGYEQECAQLDEAGKPWIQTASSYPFPIGDPRPEDFQLVDIAHHLSRLNRYTGAIQPEHYTVAEHSVRVAYYLRALVAREWQTGDEDILRDAFRAGLMHDAHEAYLNDLNSPLKRHLLSIGSTGYAQLAERYDAILSARYGLAAFTHDGVNLIREADLSVLDLERPRLLGPPPRPWIYLGRLPKIHTMSASSWGWRPNEARTIFLREALRCGVVDP